MFLLELENYYVNGSFNFFFNALFYFGDLVALLVNIFTLFWIYLEWSQ